jgi:peptidoglycan-associated lipoprotein
MYLPKQIQPISILSLLLVLASCSRTNQEAWDDARTAGRYFGSGFYALGGKQGDSRQIASRNEFYATSDSWGFDDGAIASSEGSEIAMAEFKVETLSRSSSTQIPGIDGFTSASQLPEVSRVFRTIKFPFDASTIKGEENVRILREIGTYMKAHPNLYVYVEGHCDDRGAEAYNLSLGSRRSNAVRNYLIREGVNPANLLTISYGKERPLVRGKGEEYWAQNRRVEFKVYFQGR